MRKNNIRRAHVTHTICRHCNESVEITDCGEHLKTCSPHIHESIEREYSHRAIMADQIADMGVPEFVN